LEKKTKKVIVFGSLNMDLSIGVDTIPTQGETLIGKDFFSSPGGKGANQAVAAAKLGATTYMLGKVGSDSFANEIRKSIKKFGVNDKYLLTSQISSGIAIIIRNNSDNRIILESGANNDVKAIEFNEILEEIGEEGDILVTQLESSPKETFEIIKKAHTMGLTTILNPAPAMVLPENLYNFIDILVVNQTECEILTGLYPEDLEDEKSINCLKNLYEKGIQIPILTLGEKGSITFANGEIIKITAKKVKTLDTTAAGDTYIGAIAAILASGKSIKEALDIATKASAITVTRLGAQESIPNLSEI